MVIERIYGTYHLDKCRCFYSISGCAPITLTIRSVLDPLNICFHLPYHIILLIFLINGPQWSLDVAESIMRLLTFEALGLTHTCCKAYWCSTGTYFDLERFYIDGFDEEDAEEIHDEEREYIAEFEILLEELLGKYKEFGLPLWDYLQGYWCARVKE
ncbi:hypothetical protein BJX70DRAFT_76123 [Aspergillus crustosus]